MRRIKESIALGFVWGIILVIIISIVMLTNFFSKHLFEIMVEPITEVYLNTMHSKAYEENKEHNARLMSDQDEKLNRLLKLSTLDSVQQDLTDVLQTISYHLPEAILFLLEQNHVLIEFVDYELTSISEAFIDVSGFYDAMFKKIYIQTKGNTFDKEFIVAVFLHEVGHAVDHLFYTTEHSVNDNKTTLKILSDQQLFQELFLQTRDVMMTPAVYGYEDPVEYFAQMFYLYYYAPQVLSERNPKMVSFMNQINETITVYYESEIK